MSGNFSGANPASHFMFVGRQKSADGGAFISFLIFIHKIKFSMFVDDSIAHFCVFFSSEVTLWLHILQRRYYIRTGNLNPSCRSHARLWLSEKIYTGYKILSEKIRTQIWVQISELRLTQPLICLLFVLYFCVLHHGSLLPCGVYWALQRDQWTTSSLLNTGGGYFLAEVQLLVASCDRVPAGQKKPKPFLKYFTNNEPKQ